MGTIAPLRGATQVLSAVIDKLMRRLSHPKILTRLWWVPSWVAVGWKGYLPTFEPWEPFTTDVPDDLLDIAGIRRDPELELKAFQEDPIGDWTRAHADTHSFIRAAGWRFSLWQAPRRGAYVRKARFRLERAARKAKEHPLARTETPAELTTALKALAAELGISACGVAMKDDKYIFRESAKDLVGDRMVVCALESRWDAAQTAPGLNAERALTVAAAELVPRVSALTEFLAERGYRVMFKPPLSGGIVLNFAVEAGMGQLGLNGQVLTPNAGSRARFLMFNTDAPLEIDRPVDYGIHGVCNACKVCVRRCPAGAIPATRSYYRGVEKAKLNTKRCAPVMAATQECAICMKVCPIQRYGLQSVIDHYTETGTILGKDTEELESYVFLGLPFGVGQKPRLTPEFYAQVPYHD